MLFQSTLPHGERRISLLGVIEHFEFQSTLPHGERRYDENGNAISGISIHAPTRGATATYRVILHFNRHILALFEKHNQKVVYFLFQPIHFSRKSEKKSVNLVGFLRSLLVRSYTIRGPSKSMLFLAPICSIRVRHSSPK